MTIGAPAGTTWPRRRLLVRSTISAILPFGWTWAALTALIPYLLIGHGSGTGSVAVLGATRATWMSLHVWSTIAMSLLTVAHVVLNRKGVARSLRIVSGAPHRASSARPAKRGFVWVGVLLLVAFITVGGYWFASVDDTHAAGNGRNTATVQSDTALVGTDSTGGYRGGRR